MFFWTSPLRFAYMTLTESVYGNQFLTEEFVVKDLRKRLQSTIKCVINFSSSPEFSQNTDLFL